MVKPGDVPADLPFIQFGEGRAISTSTEKEMRFQLYGPAFNVQGMLHESRTMSTLQNL